MTIGMKGVGVSRTITMVAVAVALIAFAAKPFPAQSSTEEQVIRLQREFQDKCVAGDVDAIGAMMTDDAIFIHGNGAMQRKAEFLGAIKSGQLSLSGYDLKDPRVMVFEGGAIVSGLEDLTFKPPAGSNAPPRVIHMRGSAVWIHTTGIWRLVLDQDTTLAGPPAAASSASH
jgi:ketosteroid isomerase-like protein